VVAVVCSNDIEFVRSLGDQDIWDGQSRDFEDARNKVDAIVDTVGGDIQERSLRFLKPDGILVTIVSTNRPPAGCDLSSSMLRSLPNASIIFQNCWTAGTYSLRSGPYYPWQISASLMRCLLALRISVERLCSN